jgi:hypothetical protein
LLTLFVRLNSIQPFVRFSVLNGDIDGFSDLQATLGINVLSTLFKTDMPGQ